MYSSNLTWVKDVISQNESLSYLSDLTERIEKDIDLNPNAVFDTSKSLVESTCKIFLKDLNIAYSEKADLPYLINLVLSSSLTIPPLSNITSDEKQSLKMITGGINGTIGGMCFLRNKLGIIGHGKDVDQKQSSPIIARFISQISDSISGFVLSISKEIRNISSRTRCYYTDNLDFNDWFDELYPTKIGEYEISASEALFKTDIDAYKEELINFLNSNNDKIL